MKFTTYNHVNLEKPFSHSGTSNCKSV